MQVQIDRIRFKNYRQYGTSEINFRRRDGADTDLFAFVAQNGTGKTTLLKSITWCLYGWEAEGLSGGKSDAKALPLVNMTVFGNAAERENIPVSVSFRFTDEEGNVIECIRRTAYKKQGKLRWTQDAEKFTVTVTPAGSGNTITQEDERADAIVKQYFDASIYNFYFFDGEKLTDFFTSSKNLKDSIFNIAQVNLLKDVLAHIKTLQTERNRKLGKALPDVGRLQREIETKEQLVKSTEAAREEAKAKEKTLKQAVRQLEKDLRGFRPVQNLQREREQLMEQQKGIDKRRIEIRRKRSAFIREYLTLLHLYPRMKAMYQYISTKSRKGELPPAIDRGEILKLLDHPGEPCPLCGQHVSEEALAHLNALLEEYKISSQSSNFLSQMMGPLEAAMRKAENYEFQRDALMDEYRDIEGEARKVQTGLDRVDEAITQYGGEEGTKHIAQVNQQYHDKQRELEKCQNQIGRYDQTIESAEAELAKSKKELEGYEEKAHIQQDIKDQLRVLRKLHDAFQTVQDTIVNETKEELQSLTWQYFQEMIWKKNTFGSITIDDSYNVAVYDKAGHIMTDSLSATEQMALAYSFTLAVHHVSGRNCPLVIDSPLGRVSDDNREKMARSLLTVAKDKQIIMLFTPDEYSPAVAAMYDKEATVQNLHLSRDESVVEGVEPYGR